MDQPLVAPHHGLSRLVVRMQHDLALADRLIAEARAHRIPPELARLGLGERERAFLAALDPRAFRVEPLRRRRVLQGLMSELKASAAIALAETRRIAFLDGFFTSAPFHEAVQARGSLAEAFAAFLLGAGLRTPQLRGVVGVELELARSRRALEAAGGVDWKAPPIPPAPSGDSDGDSDGMGGLTHVAIAPGVGASRHDPDALDAINAVERYLFEVGLVPALVLVDDAPRLELPAPTGRPPVALGFVPTQAGITIVHLDDDLYAALAAVLAGAGDPPTVPVERIGRPLAVELVEQEILVAAPPPAA